MGEERGRRLLLESARTRLGGVAEGHERFMGIELADLLSRLGDRPRLQPR